MNLLLTTPTSLWTGLGTCAKTNTECTWHSGQYVLWSLVRYSTLAWWWYRSTRGMLYIYIYKSCSSSYWPYFQYIHYPIYIPLLLNSSSGEVTCSGPCIPAIAERYTAESAALYSRNIFTLELDSETGYRIRYYPRLFSHSIPSRHRCACSSSMEC